MKKVLFLTVILAVAAGTMNAQQATTVILLNHSTLKKKVEKSDEDIAHEKKGVKPTTWVKRGELFQDVFNQGLEQMQVGLDKTMMTINYGEPESTETKDGVTIYKYETINYYFEGGQMRGWTRNDPIHEAPLQEALRSFEKALALEDEGKKEKLQEKMEDELTNLKDQFIRSGQNHYYLGDKKTALKEFEAVIEIDKEFSIFNDVVDTLMINFSAIVAKDIAQEENSEEMYRESIKYYQQLTDLGYGGSTVYLQMDPLFKIVGDTVGAIESLQKGLKQYPDSSFLVALTAQTYYQLDENEKGLAFINKRLADRPDCATAYFWKGLLISNQPEISEDTIKMVLELYEKALELDPDNGQIWFQSGYVNYALGANKFELESYEEDEALRKQHSKEGKEYYNVAIEKLEKAYDLLGNEKSLQIEALDLLKRIYYKLYGMEDARYKDVQQRLNNL